VPTKKDRLENVLCTCVRAFASSSLVELLFQEKMPPFCIFLNLKWSKRLYFSSKFRIFEKTQIDVLKQKGDKKYFQMSCDMFVNIVFQFFNMSALMTIPDRHQIMNIFSKFVEISKDTSFGSLQ
jgi:hypothetical protein